MKHTKALTLFVALVLALSSIGLVAAQDQTTLRLAWWGGDQRAALYNGLADKYEAANPTVKLEREFAGWAPYWERLATQTAGGNPPDILHMHLTYLNEYVSRGALLDLTPFIESGQIDLSAFPEGIVNTGKVDGKVYIITLGNSAPGTHYNTRMFQEAGVEAPAYTWTWADYMETAKALQAKLPAGVFASSDSGGWDSALETFVVQNGETLFNEEGKLGFSKDTLRAYWQFWQDMRAAGTLPPIETTVERSQDGVENNMLVQGMIAMHMMSGNQHRLFQQNTKDELALTSLPRSNEAGAPGGDIVGGAYIAISAASKNPEKSAAFINWLVNDPEVAKTYNAEHGPVGSVKMQEVVASQQQPADLRLNALMNAIASEVVAPAIRPQKGGEVIGAFGRTYQELAFGRIGSVEEAVDKFFEEAEFILE